ncbi:MAG TPA: response regulator transcription factor [Ignavibacteriaceae bacterium]|nr:response regulator transcription factor [Ignavibacteriaceae bacterium]
MKNVLIIEDDKEISDLLELHLKDLNCEIQKCYDGSFGLKTAKTEQFNLIVLDIMLPGIDGFEICKELRKAEINTPILMLTSKSEETDKVLGLEFGADDYLTKPFSIREFIARVKAIFRRVETLSSEKKEVKDIKYKDLVIDVTNRKILLKNDRIYLTPKEFDLLYLMASHPGRTYTRENLLNIIWGTQYSGYDHTVNSHINRLRTKIEDDVSNPKYILTSWGVGYRFNDE